VATIRISTAGVTWAAAGLIRGAADNAKERKTGTQWGLRCQTEIGEEVSARLTCRLQLLGKGAGQTAVRQQSSDKQSSDNENLKG
jgi:hypothetical protein